MRPRTRIQRRAFLRGMVGVAGASLLAGCKVQPAPTTAPTEAAATAAPAGTVAPTAVPATTAPAIKYADKPCVHRYMTGGFTGGGPDEKLIKDIQEEALRTQYGLNIDLRVESAPWNDFDTLITTRLETQATDSVERDTASVLNWLAQPGLVQNIDPYLDQYGQHLREFFPKASFDYFDRGDGKTWSWTTLYQAPVDCEYIDIRRDWLDKIDRDVPQTIEDLIECLALFKEKKLGGDVTIPLASELGGWLIPSYVLTGPFAPEPDEQLKMLKAGEDFEYEFGCAMREPRLELLRKLHQDGLLNPEWATSKEEDTFGAIEKGMVGCIFSGYWTANGRLQTVERDVDPKQDWVQIYPPVGLKGRPETARILAEIPCERAVILTTWAHCPEAIIAFADWENSSLENYMLSVYGIEGKHWKWGDNGCIVNLRSNPPNEEYTGMRSIFGSLKWRNQINLLPPEPGKEPKDPMVNKHIYGPHFYNRPQINVPQKGEYPMLVRVYHLVAWNFAESAKFEPDLRALRDEHATKIIKGETPVKEGIKAFWDAWFAAGGDKRVQEISDQYDVYIQRHPEMADPKIYFSPENWNTQIEYPPLKNA